MRYSDKVTVVTGAAGGMGRALALQLAKEGAKVIAVDCKVDELNTLPEEAKGLDGEIMLYPGDLRDQKICDGMIDMAVEKYGKLDVLFSNAGIMDDFMPAGDTKNELWDDVFAVNVTAPFHAIRKALSVMLEQENGGTIISTASNCGVFGCRAGAAYTASKHAMIGLVKNTAYMYGHKKIRINAICPGNVPTAINNFGKFTEIEGLNEFGFERVCAGVDFDFAPGETTDIAQAACFLGSEEAKWLNGAVIVIDGGASSN